MMSENSKLCVGCMSFGKAGTMHDWTLDEAQTDEMAAGHLARPTWKSESLRGRTDRVAVGKYDCMEEADMKIVTHVHELAEKYQCKDVTDCNCMAVGERYCITDHRSNKDAVSG